ncbi:hypothetical protein [Streptomyces candidus]|uniref:LPXTG cell wall anchor domain-containing protein n=1 Tax=Streptomyces candidus TaxID=67283 RepID=A0A7X0HG03_9ACTN|nr:hypothetical protein [Streptomyces candidus]MBB6436960.1 hypothetical protein [Streptomyces candidus]GHH32412.1 hypothetical protein GCM10018773_01430 [Streptomyces candidus]
MRSAQLTLCAGVVLAAVIVPAPTALALAPAALAPGAVRDNEESHGSVTVTPSTIAAGGEVDLRIGICGGKKAIGHSEAFSSPAHFHPAADGVMFAEARIRSDAEGRDYGIHVKCEDGSGSADGNVTVVHHRVEPTAPVRAGGGGTAALAADTEGPGTPYTLIGLGLAGVAAVAIAGRSVRKRRGTTH